MVVHKLHNSELHRFWRRWRILRWGAPFTFLPHGGSGVVVAVVGLFFLIQAVLVGPYPAATLGYDINGPRPRWLFDLFLLSATVNATSSIFLLKKAPPFSRLPFIFGVVIQLSSIWFALRFSRIQEYHFIVAVLDQFFALVLLLGLVGLQYVITTRAETLLLPPLLFGSLGLGLTAFYPMQIALWGHGWLVSVLQRYPYQRVVIVSYIQVPLIFCFAMIFFGGTLLQRKIVEPGLMSATYFLSIVLILVSTVLATEVYVSQVSTQELLILVQEHERLPAWLVSFAKATGFVSPLAQTILKTVGIPLNPPPMH